LLAIRIALVSSCCNTDQYHSQHTPKYYLHNCFFKKHIIAGTLNSPHKYNNLLTKSIFFSSYQCWLANSQAH
jgi:hypothetical protein